MDENFESLKVMVIDDSKTIRRTAETLLKKVGCNVITAVDGFDALAKIADNHPDIIFVDIMMPRLDGYQTCALIKNNAAFRSTPVIMLSSKDGLFDKAKENLDSHIFAASSVEEAKALQEEHGGFIKTMWCGDLACEEKMKEEAGMSSRCIPFEQEDLGDTCPCCGKPAKHMIYWGIAY